MHIFIAVPFRKFELEEIFSTPGALNACTQQHLAEYLNRHLQGDLESVLQGGRRHERRGTERRRTLALRLSHRPGKAVQRLGQK